MNTDKEKSFIPAEIILQMNIQNLQNVLENNRFPVMTVMQRLQQLGYSWKFATRMNKNLLHFAAEEGDCEAIKALLDAKVYDVNEFENEMFHNVPYTSMTALNYACRGNHFEAVKLLVSYGADVKLEGKMSHPIILDAIHEKDTEMFDYILEQGANINATSNFGFRCIDLAARKGNLGLLDRLLAMGANPQEKSRGMKLSILHEACREVANPQVIKRCMDLGLNPHEPSALSWTPIDLLIMHGNREALSLMMSYGVVNVYAYNRAGETGLHSAVIASNLETAQLLLESGANPNQSMRLEDKYPIQSAVEAGDPAMVDLLLRFGANRNLCSKTGESLLIKAIKAKNLAVIEVLWRAGIDFNAPSVCSQSLPLHYACATGNLPVIHKLIDCGAFVNGIDVDGQTALHKEAAFNKPEIVYALLQRGANPNAKDKFLRSPLDYAENDRIKQILREAGSQEITTGAALYRCMIACFCCCCDR